MTYKRKKGQRATGQWKRKEKPESYTSSEKTENLSMIEV